MTIRLAIDVDVRGGREVATLNSNINRLGREAPEAGRRVDGTTVSVSRLGRTANFVRRAVAGLFVGIGAGIFVQQIIRANDELINTNNLLSASGLSGLRLAGAQREVAQLANETRSSYEATASLFARINRSANLLGVSQQEVLTVTRAFNQSLQLSGSNVQEARAATIQFGQALGSGRLQGDELRSILENNSFFAARLAEQMGLTVGQLREAGAEGRLGVQEVLTATLAISNQINEDFANLTPTLGQSFIVLGNGLTLSLGRMSQVSGIANTIGQTVREWGSRLTEFSSNAEGISRLLGRITAVAQLAGLALVGFVAVKTINGIRTAVTVMRALRLATVGTTLAAFAIPIAIGALAAAAFLARDQIVPAFVGIGNVLKGVAGIIGGSFAVAYLSLQSNAADAVIFIATRFFDLANTIVRSINDSGLAQALGFQLNEVGGTVLRALNSGRDLINIGLQNSRDFLAESNLLFQQGLGQTAAAFVAGGGDIVDGVTSLIDDLTGVLDPERLAEVTEILTGGMDTEVIEDMGRSFAENFLNGLRTGVNEIFELDNPFIAIGASLNRAFLFDQNQQDRIQAIRDSEVLSEAEKSKSIEMITESSQENRAKSYATAGSTILTQLATQSRAAFNIGKGLAVAQAAIDGTAAVQAALKGPPGPPFSFAIAAVTAAVTAANIGQIASQQYQGLQTGGSITQAGSFIVGENGREVVNLPAGAAVIGNRPTEDLLGGGGEGGGDVFENVIISPQVGFGRSAQSTADAIGPSILNMFSNGEFDRRGQSVIPRRNRI